MAHSDPALAIARGQLDAAWAAVTATWVSTMFSGLVIGSAFAVIAVQRFLDQRQSERRRQYNNLLILVEAMFAMNYIEFCYEYLGLAGENGKIVYKHPIVFYLMGNSRGLDHSSADREVGPGPTGVASRVTVIAQYVVNRMTQICTGEYFTADQMVQARDFIDSIRPDLADVWSSLKRQQENIMSTPEGHWAEMEFCRRSRTPSSGKNVMAMLKAGHYSPERAPN